VNRKETLQERKRGGMSKRTKEGKEGRKTRGRNKIKK